MFLKNCYLMMILIASLLLMNSCGTSRLVFPVFDAEEDSFKTVTVVKQKRGVTFHIVDFSNLEKETIEYRQTDSTPEGSNARTEPGPWLASRGCDTMLINMTITDLAQVATIRSVFGKSDGLELSQNSITPGIGFFPTERILINDNKLTLTKFWAENKED